MPSSTPPPLGTIVIPPESLKPDQDLLDRYIKFSEELLRLSLLAIGAVGFLVTNFVLKASPEQPGTEALALLRVKLALSAALAFFLVACAAALLHRYFATDGFACHVAGLRKYIRSAGWTAASCRPRPVATGFRDFY
jgi:hypothetical protein